MSQYCEHCAEYLKDCDCEGSAVTIKRLERELSECEWQRGYWKDRAVLGEEWSDHWKAEAERLARQIINYEALHSCSGSLPEKQSSESEVKRDALGDNPCRGLHSILSGGRV